MSNQKKNKNMFSSESLNGITHITPSGGFQSLLTEAVGNKEIDDPVSKSDLKVERQQKIQQEGEGVKAKSTTVKKEKTSDKEKSLEDETKVRHTFFIKKKYVRYLIEGRIEEKFRNDSEFQNHILEQYFKGKPYTK
jgi:hypothetical protein